MTLKEQLGELGNTRYIHPIFARRLVELVKEAGGQPFLTDTTTLYRRKRSTLFDYLSTAGKNGFTSETMGCPIIIADGLHGTNGKWIELPSFSKFKRVKVAQAIYKMHRMWGVYCPLSIRGYYSSLGFCLCLRCPKGADGWLQGSSLHI